jgi:hypothetical protein
MSVVVVQVPASDLTTSNSGVLFTGASFVSAPARAREVKSRKKTATANVDIVFIIIPFSMD